MTLFAFFNDTPLWLLVPIGLIYTGILGYFVYTGFRLFHEDFF